jgi:sec-independent protein translocase protein TatC
VTDVFALRKVLGGSPLSRRDGGLPGPSSSAAPDEDVAMSLVEHLSELRRRLIISGIGVAIGSVAGFIAAPHVITFLKSALPIEGPIVFTGLGDAFFINLKIALTMGVILAMPLLLLELWGFISPGLTAHERRTARPWVPLALLFFAVGVGVAYVVLPYASSFLLSFQSPDLKALITADRYFDFVTTLFLGFGLVMEFPIVLVLLSKVGVVSSDFLRRRRRMAILVIGVASTVITPGGDLLSPFVMGIVLFLLYELSIKLVRAGGH